MAVSTPVNLQGAVVKIGTTDIADDTIEMTLTLSRGVSTVDTFGASVSAVGQLQGSGTITVLYTETASTGHQLLETEMFTPTAGGIAVTLQPKGLDTSTPGKEYEFNIVVTGEPVGGNATDIVQVAYDFQTTGTITVGSQSAS